MSILDAYPEYAATARLDALRRSEYGYLDEQGCVYLDYAGSGLAARAQLRAHAQRLADGPGTGTGPDADGPGTGPGVLLGNPHSASPPSARATALVEAARARVLRHFAADPAEYAVVFTPNATGAARLVGEAYPWGRRGLGRGRRGLRSGQRRLVLTADNHNSLNGLREYARRHGAATAYVPCAPDLTVDPQALLDALGPVAGPAGGPAGGRRWWPALGRLFCGRADNDDDDDSTPDVADDHPHGRGLFAYPAQSNFSGVRHPLAWVGAAQQRGYDVLLDAAAYLPTAALDLSPASPHRADFVLVSWYKLFGYPTGVGCLVARRAALARLRRPWFAGGTVRAASVQLDWHLPAARPEARFEDGTVNFHAIPDVVGGLDWLAGGGGGSLLPLVQTRVRCLTAWFLDRLVALRHSNGQPMARVYGPTANQSTRGGSTRGGTVAFNLLDPAGALVDERLVGAAAAAAGIALRTGCFCNPGAGEAALGFARADLVVLQRLATAAAAAEEGAGDPPQDSNSSLTLVDTKEAAAAAAAAAWPVAGAVRVSFGVASTAADVDRFFAFVDGFRDRAADRRLGARTSC